MNSWYSLKATSAESADVHIYNEIGGWGITAEAFANDLKAIKAKTLNVRINSPGGSAFDAFAIYNTLRNHPAQVVTHVDGLAASAASIIMLAGESVNIAKNAFIMIHNASSGVWGTADDMRREAKTLDKINKTIAKAYAEKTGKTQEEMQAAMDEETWYDAEEAKALGLVDAISDDEGDMPSATAKAVEKFNKAPNALRRFAAMYIEKTGQSDPPAPVGTGAPAANLEKPMTLEAFKAFAAEHPDAVASYVDSGKKAGSAETRTAELARAKAIREACGGNDTLALDTFLAGKDADEAKATIDAVAKAKADTDATIKAQAAEIERLKAQIGTQPAIAGADRAAAANDKKDDTDPAKPDPDAAFKAQAEAEWDAKADGTAKFRSKENYVFFRVQVLSGRHVA